MVKEYPRPRSLCIFRYQRNSDSQCVVCAWNEQKKRSRVRAASDIKEMRFLNSAICKNVITRRRRTKGKRWERERRREGLWERCEGMAEDFSSFFVACVRASSLDHRLIFQGNFNYGRKPFFTLFLTFSFLWHGWKSIFTLFPELGFLYYARTGKLKILFILSLSLAFFHPKFFPVHPPCLVFFSTSGMRKMGKFAGKILNFSIEKTLES